ncbi:unnamed protein product [Allacma fusca]|uniref:Peptidase S1 domain-containing protein n=1 Tax=Allacma fusca TaxID=39272 RepID=A0A8J2NSV1_9HEXA|nr:unnamed protein product [Allacma fusca]
MLSHWCYRRRECTEDCEVAYGKGAILDSMVCAGHELGGKDTCRGDTGGPLILNDIKDGRTVIGISSWGLGCGNPGFPGVYTNVGFYTDWIEENMKD